MKTEPKIKITEHYAYGWVNPRVIYGSNPDRHMFSDWQIFVWTVRRWQSKFYRFIGWRK